jgi:hypothetical protein
MFEKLLTGLKELLARVAMQAASAMGLRPASTRAAAQETTVGARAAMHSVAVVSDVASVVRRRRHTKLGAASCFLSGQEGLSLSLQGVDGRSVTDDHRGRASSGRWRSHGDGSESRNDGGDGELHFESCVGTKEDR